MDTTKNGQDVLCDADSVQHQPVVSQYRKASVRYTMQVELSSSSGLVSSQPQPYSYMVEQPAKCGVRFRYECEGRISSAIPGASSSTARFTYPTIAVANYAGPVKVIVSCVTKNAPHRPHPHNLVGKKYCQQGICMAIFPEAFCQFTNLGILCAKRKDVKDRLRTREQLRVDPYGTGFSHRSHTSKLIDLNVVRLCFQVFLPDPDRGGQFCVPLEPIVSEEIFDKKAMSELSIAKLSHYSGPASGGQSIILLCDRVLKDDIQVRFFLNDSNGRLCWEKFALIGSNDIHKHFAIMFRVPSFDLNMNHRSKVTVKVQLRRPSDGCVSDPVTFQYCNNNSFNINSSHSPESDYSESSTVEQDDSLMCAQHSEAEQLEANDRFSENGDAYDYSSMTTTSQCCWQTYSHTGHQANVTVKSEYDQFNSQNSFMPLIEGNFNMTHQYKSVPTQPMNTATTSEYLFQATLLDISQSHPQTLNPTGGHQEEGKYFSMEM